MIEENTPADDPGAPPPALDLSERGPIGYLLLDRGGVIRDANEAVAELLNAPRSALVDRPLSHLLAKESAAALPRRLERAFSADHIMDCEVLRPNGDGRPAHLRLVGHCSGRGEEAELRVAVTRAYVRGEDAEPGARSDHEQLVGALDDAQRRLQQSDARVWQVADALSTGCAYVDADLRFLRVNATGAKAAGRTIGDMVGRTIPELVGAEKFEEVQDYYRHALAGHEVRFDSRSELTRPPVWVEIHLLPDLDGDVVRGLFVLGRDVTVRRAVEDALRNRTHELDLAVEARTVEVAGLRRQVEVIRDAVVTTDASWRVQTWNQAAEEMFGWTSRDAIGRGLLQVLGCRDEEAQTQRLFEAALLESGAWRGQLRVERPDRDEIRVEATVWSMGDAAGARGAIFVFRDITRAEAQRELLHDREARLEAVVNHALDGILTVGETGAVESFNPAAERMFGYPAREVIGRNVRMLLGPRDLERRDGDETVPGILGWRREVVGRRSDGSRFPIQLAVSHVRNGRPRFVATLRDVTAQVEAEKALREERDFAEGLIETAPIVVLVLDPEGRVVRFNRHLEKLTGRSLDETRGEDWFETFIPPRFRSDVHETFEGALAGHRTSGKATPILARDGSERLIEWHDTLLTDEAGTLRGLLAIGRDITDERRLAETYRTTQKMEAIGTLAAGIAHDFSNLLMGIIGMADMCLNELEPGHPPAELIERIRSAAHGGAQIVGQLLAFSRRGTEGAEDELTLETDLDELVEGTRAILGALLGEDIELRVELGARDAPVKMSTTHLQQILMNLAANARQAMQKGGTLTIRTHLVDLKRDSAERPAPLAPGQYVALEVTDTGCGMDARTCARVFEPFFTTKADMGGTGLGLSTVDSIVRQAEGAIGVESQLGRGTTFRTLLPCGHRRPVAPEGVSEERTPAPRGHGETVLVVEDEDLVRMTLAYYLGAEGYSVLEAQDAAQALALCRERGDEIDVVISDMVLPDAQGSDLAREIRQRLPRTRLLFMSAHTRDQLMRTHRLEPGTPLLQKPFSRADLARALSSSLDAHHELG